MKKIITIATIGFVLLAGQAVTAGQAGDDAFSRQLVAQWEEDRDRYMMQTLQTWLRGAPEPEWLVPLTRLANVCMNIAITVNRDEPALEAMAQHDCPPAALLAWYLADQGRPLDVEAAFAGQQFEVSVPVGYFDQAEIADAQAVPALVRSRGKEE
jgi:hypothetical protein